MRNRINALVLCALMTCCSGRISEELDTMDDSGGVETGGADSEPAGNVVESETSMSVETGGACSNPASSLASSNPLQPPSQIGCYLYVAGGWQAIPCDCELWLTNTEPVPVAVTFSLTFSPDDLAPSLSNSPDLPNVEIIFEDPDSGWYTEWAQQAGNGSHFSVANAQGVTTVRLGTKRLVLSPVPLPACEERRPRASITAPWGTAWRLDMQATILDSAGNLVSTPTGSCHQPESHPTAI